VLASLVIKIEYCRTLHRGSKEPSRPGPASCLPVAEHAPISRFPAAEMPSASSIAPAFLPGLPRARFAKGSVCPSAFLPGSAQYVECDVTLSKQTTAPFLPGSRIASHGSRQGTAFYPELRRAAVPSLVCHDEEKSFRPGRHGFRVNPDGIHPEQICEGRNFTCALACPGEFPAGLPRALFAKGSFRSTRFLTETASHSETAVTHSKQTIATFLTGARTAQLAISDTCVSTPQNLMLLRRPIQIFLRPTI
jgi:hypothetical protein